MTNDFETHPIGTGKRLAELEGLAFARRRTEHTCPVADEDAVAARDAYHADFYPPLPWVDLNEAYRVSWRRAAEAVRDRLSGREMVAEPTYHDGYETGRRDEAQAQSAMRIAPIDPADVRKGDRVRVVTEGVVSEVHHPGEFYMRQDDGETTLGIDPTEPGTTLYLLDRPDPDAERAEQLRDALIAITSQPLRYLGSISTDEIRAALKAARLTIEPAAKEADRA